MLDFESTITNEMVLEAQSSEEGFKKLFYHPECLMIKKSLTKGIYDPWKIDHQDLYQVIDIAVWLAVRDFKIDGNSKFTTWLNFVIKRKIADFLRVNNNQRNQFERQHQRLEDEVYNTDKPSNVVVLVRDIIPCLDTEPLQLIVKKENTVEANQTVNSIFELLTPLERHCVEAFYLQKKSYKEIGNELNITPKTVDNAIQRVKIKIKKSFVATAV